jgi:hypothetical protein
LNKLSTFFFVFRQDYHGSVFGRPSIAVKGKSGVFRGKDGLITPGNLL